eukprot:6870523-Pyramimonas_sp.AAC.1
MAPRRTARNKYSVAQWPHRGATGATRRTTSTAPVCGVSPKKSCTQDKIQRREGSPKVVPDAK